MDKQNCWEIKKCGREPGGERIDELGVCPAAIDTANNSVNGGHNGGRLCWVIAGTLSEQDVCGEYAKKIDSCTSCEVFKQVKEEEGEDFCISNLYLQSSLQLINKILMYNYARFELQESNDSDTQLNRRADVKTSCQTGLHRNYRVL